MRSNAGDELPRVLAHFIVSGDVHHLSFLRRLVGILSLSPNLPSSLSLALPLGLHYFHLLPSSTTFLFNLLIRAFSRSRHPHLSISLFSSLLRAAALPDRFTFPSLAVSHASRNAHREGHQSHSHIIKNGFDSDLYVINTLIFMYSAFRDMKSSRKVFDLGFQVVDVVSWNSVIDGYVKSGALDDARKLFDEMPVRNEVSWSAIISGYVGKGELDIARFLFDRMPMIGRNVVTWNLMVSGFARHGLVSLARELFDQMPVRNVVSWNSMVSGYAMNGEMTSARELFEAMPEKDVVSWSCMISGYAQTSHHAEALKLFKRMQTESEARPNEVTMVSVLSACAHLSALDQGKRIHAYINKNNMILDDDNNLGAALIDMYAKCGGLETGIELFGTLERKNVSSWNALITGMAINGSAVESLDAFERMRESGVRPNDITFLGVLTACTHGGLVVEGRRYFESMSKDYGIEPVMKHYGCMIDLLGRSGLLEEAEGIIRSMPMKPDVMILGALLGACRIYKNMEVADRIRNNFLELKSRQAGCHVLLSNIYAAAGRWSDASCMRSLLKEKGIKKEPGSSSIEMDE